MKLYAKNLLVTIYRKLCKNISAVTTQYIARCADIKNGAGDGVKKMIVVEAKFDGSSWRIKTKSAGKGRGKRYELHRYFKIQGSKLPGREIYSCNKLTAAIAYYFAALGKYDIVKSLFLDKAKYGGEADLTPYIPFKHSRNVYRTVDFMTASDVKPIFINVGRIS